MATSNTPTVATDAERPPATGQPPGAGKVRRFRRRHSPYWLEYTLIGAGIDMMAGTLLVAWGSAQDSPAFLWVGIVLFSVGFLGWLGVFIALTWQLARSGAPLIARLLQGVRRRRHSQDVNHQVVHK